MREARARYSDMTRRGGALNAELRPRRTPRGDHRDDAPDAATATPVRASSSSHPADSSSSPRALHPAAADALRHIDALARRVGLPRANDPARGSARTFPAEAETRAAADRTLEAERVDAERHREARVRARVRAARDDRDDTSRPTVPRHFADVSRPTVPRPPTTSRAAASRPTRTRTRLTSPTLTRPSIRRRRRRHRLLPRRRRRSSRGGRRTRRSRTHARRSRARRTRTRG